MVLSLFLYDCDMYCIESTVIAFDMSDRTQAITHGLAFGLNKNGMFQALEKTFIFSLPFVQSDAYSVCLTAAGDQY